MHDSEGFPKSSSWKKIGLGGPCMNLYDEDIFAPLRREFAAELPARLDCLKAYYAAWKSSRAADFITGMIQEAHKLAGTAGALGFDGIGDEMCEIERMLRGAGSPAVFSEELCARLDQSLVSCYRQAGLKIAISDPAHPETSKMRDLSKILMIDDDASIRTIAQLSLAEVGKFSVSMAASGNEGLERLRTEKPDVILLDVMMPDMDGPTTLVKIHQQIGDDTPIIFMTAKVRNSEMDEYRALGAAGVIPKPFDPMLLPGQIRRIVAEWAQGR
jgi:two-component system, OmpR family, response regulator